MSSNLLDKIFRSLNSTEQGTRNAEIVSFTLQDLWL